MNRYLFELKMAQAQEKLRLDIEEALGTPQEQYERLERLIEACTPTRPTRPLRKDIDVPLDLRRWRNRF